LISYSCEGLKNYFVVFLIEDKNFLQFIYAVLGVWYYDVEIRFVGGIMNCKFGSV